MGWDVASISRDQLVLFAERLDEVLPEDHLVRRMVEILDQLNWTGWEAEYKHESAGRPPIHPQIMSGIVLYGLMRGVRSSRRLEEALQMRLDFRWLAEGRSIDHSTICRFRQLHRDRLKELFVQIVMVAKCAGVLSLVELAVDGTKIRSSNHRSKKYKVEELQNLKQQLELRFDQLNAEADALDSQEVTQKEKLEKRSRSLSRRLNEIGRAIKAVEQLKEEDKPVPTRIPTTDVQSRVTKCKEGSFAPNYTPVTVVDPVSGMVAGTQVIADCNEKTVLPGVLDEIEETLGEKPQRVLADAIFNHSSNLIQMNERDIELYTPIQDPLNNPADREDLTKPVTEDQRDQLPRDKKGQLTNLAFTYDAQRNSYFCPQGKELPFNSSYNQKQAGGTTIKRHRYHASQEDCVGCPLFDQCVKGKSKFRRVSRDQAEELREDLRQRMRTNQAKTTYDRRMQCELPFAAIKHLMGARQFLHRGLDKVQQEWNWLVTAFNLRRLISLLGPRGPTATATTN